MKNDFHDELPIEAISERQREVLRIVIQEFVQTAQPVGSAGIVGQYDLGVSPATIRNDLAALDLFSALAGALRSALGSERTARLQAAVEDLRFGDALRELEPFGSAQTPPDEGREGGSL